MRVIRPYKEHLAVELRAYYFWEYRLSAAEIITMTTQVAVGRPSEGEVPLIVPKCKPYDEVVAALTPVRAIIVVDGLPECVTVGSPMTMLRHVACFDEAARSVMSGHHQDDDVVALFTARGQPFAYTIETPDYLRLVLDCAHHLP